MDNQSFKAPRLVVNPDIKDFYDFTVDDFKLEGYEYCRKKYDIPVAI